MGLFGVGELQPGRVLIRITMSARAFTGNAAKGRGGTAHASMSFDIELVPDGANANANTDADTDTKRDSLIGVNTAGGLFGTATNWNPQTVPTANDHVAFDLPGTPGRPAAGCRK